MDKVEHFKRNGNYELETRLKIIEIRTAIVHMESVRDALDAMTPEEREAMIKNAADELRAKLKDAKLNKDKIERIRLDE